MTGLGDERVDCPFAGCSARPVLIKLRGDNPYMATQKLLASHRVEPDGWFGRCPAGGKVYPPNPRLQEHLDSEYERLQAMRRERAEGGTPAERDALCPFDFCMARPPRAQVRPEPGSNATRSMVRVHHVEPDSGYGLCPMSGQYEPVSPELAEHLSAAGTTLLTMRAERARNAAQVQHGIDKDRPRRPSGSGRWFRNSEQGDPRQLGPLGRPRLDPRQKPED